MGIAYEESVKCKTYEAASDLSAARFKLVKLSGERTVTTTTAITDNPIGVLYGLGDGAGQAVEVAVEGNAKVLAGVGGLAVGDRVGPATDGTGIATVTAGHRAIGECVVAAAAGKLAVVDMFRHDVA